MIVATSATVRNLTSLSEVAASAAIDSPLPACAERVKRTSHARLQRKSCTEKGNPGAGHQFRYFASPQLPYGAAPIRRGRSAAAPAAPPAGGASAAAQLAATVPRGLDGGQERGPDPVLLQLADGVD